MKIKILKDIPGYKAGDIVTASDDEIGTFISKNQLSTVIKYYVLDIICGWAEEVKDEIDIEEIRFDRRLLWCQEFEDQKITKNEMDWFTAYRIVKDVIEKLNGYWKPNTNSGREVQHETIQLSLRTNTIMSDTYENYRVNILPMIKDGSTAEKVIELCNPELEILFGVK